jgi:hypothetical protein
MIDTSLRTSNAANVCVICLAVIVHKAVEDDLHTFKIDEFSFFSTRFQVAKFIVKSP